MSEPVVSFKAACVYEEDVLLLHPGCWLNDAMLTLWIEVLTWGAPGDSHTPIADAVLLMHPSAVFMCLFEEGDELAAALRGLSLATRQVVCMPVNNAHDPSAEVGGSHWSLLVYERESNSFVHLDSVRGSGNAAVAARIAAALTPVLRPDHAGAARPTLLQPDCPQQRNGCDCGVFTLAFAERIARGASAGRSVGACVRALNGEGEQAVSQAAVAAYRQRMMDVVHSMSRSAPSATAV